ncbi:MAG: hypothetical protein DRI39_06705 [Chloroflexi bacterium]|nr:MAG: hypothetical protein DRI39_06705 [Chloroflexota bacterium]
MTVEFTHPNLGEEVEARAGYYAPLEEHVLPHEGREVLYILGKACIESSCCSAPGSWMYVQVPGFLVRKHVRGGGSAPYVSEVEIIQDRETRDRIREAIARKHPGVQVEIWTSDYIQAPQPQ